MFSAHHLLLRRDCRVVEVNQRWPPERAVRGAGNLEHACVRVCVSWWINCGSLELKERERRRVTASSTCRSSRLSSSATTLRNSSASSSAPPLLPLHWCTFRVNSRLFLFFPLFLLLWCMQHICVVVVVVVVVVVGAFGPASKLCLFEQSADHDLLLRGITARAAMRRNKTTRGPR